MSQVSLRTTIAGCGVALLFTSIACDRVSDGEAEIELSPRDALIARAASLELDTPYVPPPGDALTHHTSGFAKVLCSAVFITGLDADFAAERSRGVAEKYAVSFGLLIPSLIMSTSSG